MVEGDHLVLILRWPIHIINKTNYRVLLPTDAAPQFL